jgi:hypothetical protein
MHEMMMKQGTTQLALGQVAVTTGMLAIIATTHLPFADFYHPKIAVALGVLLLTFPVIGLTTGTLLLTGIVRRAEHPVLFVSGVCVWLFLCGTIITGSFRQISMERNMRASNQASQAIGASAPQPER